MTEPYIPFKMLIIVDAKIHRMTVSCCLVMMKANVKMIAENFNLLVFQAVPNRFDVLETRARMILMALESHLQDGILPNSSTLILPEDCHVPAYDPHGVAHSATLPTVHCVVISNLGSPMFFF
jgi:hypothetical protein